jgi:hypothetical protein
MKLTDIEKMELRIVLENQILENNRRIYIMHVTNTGIDVIKKKNIILENILKKL